MTELGATVTTLRPSQGFHFDLITDIFISEDMSSDPCPLHLLYVFPPSLFVDKYELRDKKMDFILLGETDLEAPTAAALQNQFSLSLRIEPNSTRVILPFHARYPIPSGAGSELDSYSSISLHMPSLYRHSCSSQADGFQSLNPTVYEVKVPRGTQYHRTLVEISTSLIIWLTAIYLYSVMWSVSRKRLNRKAA